MAVPGRTQLVFPRLSSVVKKLLIGLFAAYVTQLVLVVWLGMPWIELLALTPGGTELWQLLTYIAVDADGPLMFLLGLLFLWWALSPFEHAFGPRHTVQLIIVVMLAASVPAWLTGFVLPAPMLYGSSPLWFGGIAATTWPRRNQQLSLFGMATMTGKQFLLLWLGLAVLIFLASRNVTQLVAIVGAMAGGIAFIRYMARPTGKKPSIKRAAPRRGFRVIRGGGDEDDERPKYLN